MSMYYLDFASTATWSSSICQLLVFRNFDFSFNFHKSANYTHALHVHLNACIYIVLMCIACTGLYIYISMYTATTLIWGSN